MAEGPDQVVGSATVILSADASQLGPQLRAARQLVQQEMANAGGTIVVDTYVDPTGLQQAGPAVTQAATEVARQVGYAYDKELTARLEQSAQKTAQAQQRYLQARTASQGSGQAVQAAEAQVRQIEAAVGQANTKLDQAASGTRMARQWVEPIQKAMVEFNRLLDQTSGKPLTLNTARAQQQIADLQRTLAQISNAQALGAPFGLRNERNLAEQALGQAQSYLDPANRRTAADRQALQATYRQNVSELGSSLSQSYLGVAGLGAQIRREGAARTERDALVQQQTAAQQTLQAEQTRHTTRIANLESERVAAGRAYAEQLQQTEALARQQEIQTARQNALNAAFTNRVPFQQVQAVFQRNVDRFGGTSISQAEAETAANRFRGEQAIRDADADRLAAARREFPGGGQVTPSGDANLFPRGPASATPLADSRTREAQAAQVASRAEAELARNLEIAGRTSGVVRQQALARADAALREAESVEGSNRRITATSRGALQDERDRAAERARVTGQARQEAEAASRPDVIRASNLTATAAQIRADTSLRAVNAASQAVQNATTPAEGTAALKAYDTALRQHALNLEALNRANGILAASEGKVTAAREADAIAVRQLAEAEARLAAGREAAPGVLGGGAAGVQGAVAGARAQIRQSVSDEAARSAQTSSEFQRVSNARQSLGITPSSVDTASAQRIAANRATLESQDNLNRSQQTTNRLVTEGQGPLAQRIRASQQQAEADAALAQSEQRVNTGRQQANAAVAAGAQETEKALTGLARFNQQLVYSVSLFARYALIGAVISQVRQTIDSVREATTRMTRAQFELNKSAGDGAEALGQFARESAIPAGRSRIEATESIANLAKLRQEYGLSAQSIKGLQQATLDLSAVNNKTTEETSNAVALAVRGQSRTLQGYGVDASARAIKQLSDLTSAERAHFDQLSATEQAQARANEVVRQAAYYHGAAAQYAESQAGAYQKLSAASQDLATTIGTALAPAARGIATVLGGAAANLDTILTQTDKLNQQAEENSRVREIASKQYGLESPPSDAEKFRTATSPAQWIGQTQGGADSVAATLFGPPKSDSTLFLLGTPVRQGSILDYIMRAGGGGGGAPGTPSGPGATPPTPAQVTLEDRFPDALHQGTLNTPQLPGGAPQIGLVANQDAANALNVKAGEAAQRQAEAIQANAAVINAAIEKSRPTAEHPFGLALSREEMAAIRLTYDTARYNATTLEQDMEAQAQRFLALAARVDHEAQQLEAREHRGAEMQVRDTRGVAPPDLTPEDEQALKKVEEAQKRALDPEKIARQSTAAEVASYREANHVYNEQLKQQKDAADATYKHIGEDAIALQRTLERAATAEKEARTDALKVVEENSRHARTAEDRGIQDARAREDESIKAGQDSRTRSLDAAHATRLHQIDAETHAIADQAKAQLDGVEAATRAEDRAYKARVEQIDDETRALERQSQDREKSIQKELDLIDKQEQARSDERQDRDEKRAVDDATRALTDISYRDRRDPKEAAAAQREEAQARRHIQDAREAVTDTQHDREVRTQREGLQKQLQDVRTEQQARQRTLQDQRDAIDAEHQARQQAFQDQRTQIEQRRDAEQQALEGVKAAEQDRYTALKQQLADTFTFEQALIARRREIEDRAIQDTRTKEDEAYAALRENIQDTYDFQTQSAQIAYQNTMAAATAVHDQTLAFYEEEKQKASDTMDAQIKAAEQKLQDFLNAITQMAPTVLAGNFIGSHVEQYQNVPAGNTVRPYREQATPQSKDDWATAGQDATAGYVAGLQNGVPLVGDAITALITNGSILAKRAQKSASPSLVYAEIGEEAAAGYAMGIRTASDGVTGATTDMANSAAAAATPDKTITDAAAKQARDAANATDLAAKQSAESARASAAAQNEAIKSVSGTLSGDFEPAWNSAAATALRSGDAIKTSIDGVNTSLKELHQTQDDLIKQGSQVGTGAPPAGAPAGGGNVIGGGPQGGKPWMGWMDPGDDSTPEHPGILSPSEMHRYAQGPNVRDVTDPQIRGAYEAAASGKARPPAESGNIYAAAYARHLQGIGVLDPGNQRWMDDYRRHQAEDAHRANLFGTPPPPPMKGIAFVQPQILGPSNNSDLSWYTGGRAAGGPVDPHGTYLIGEEGPELLRMGDNGGRVYPHERMGSTRPGEMLDGMIGNALDESLRKHRQALQNMLPNPSVVIQGRDPGLALRRAVGASIVGRGG